MTDETFLLSILSLLVYVSLLSVFGPHYNRRLRRAYVSPRGQGTTSRPTAPVCAAEVPRRTRPTDREILALINAKTPNWPRREVID